MDGIKFTFDNKESVKITLLWYWAEKAKEEDVLDMIHRYPISPAFDKDTVMALCQECGDKSCNSHDRQWVKNKHYKAYKVVWAYADQQNIDKKIKFWEQYNHSFGDKTRLLESLEEKKPSEKYVNDPVPPEF